MRRSPTTAPLRLELETGTEVVALIKAGWLELLAIGQAATPGHNCLSGVIEEILDAEDGPSEVRIGLPNGQTLCALAQPLHLRHSTAAHGPAGAGAVRARQRVARHTGVASRRSCKLQQ